MTLHRLAQCMAVSLIMWGFIILGIMKVLQ
jgi:hypothetical protein